LLFLRKTGKNYTGGEIIWTVNLFNHKQAGDILKKAKKSFFAVADDGNLFDSFYKIISKNCLFAVFGFSK